MHSAIAELPLVIIRRDGDVPMHCQLSAAMRGAILRGELAPGTRLPSTRALSLELGVSRNTVIAAYDQLYAEGFTEAQRGRGTRVVSPLPEVVLRLHRVSAPLPSGDVRAPAGPGGSTGGWLATHDPDGPLAFSVGVPALDQFPFTLWSRLAGRRLRQGARELFDYGDLAGYPPLRTAIAEYLGIARGIGCRPEQVMVTLGAQQALDLAARLILRSGDSVLIEDPSYPGVRDVLDNLGVELIPVPVDGEGMRIQDGDRTRPARMAYVTPSHQFPLGVTMSLERRMELLEWARSADAWIVEDDYDSAYCYGGRPLPALHALDTSGRVLYIGTFSTVLFPGLRIGYVIVPAALAQEFPGMRPSLGGSPPHVLQAALCDFVRAGHFAQHVRRMRGLYVERRSSLLNALARYLGEVVQVVHTNTGMHLAGFLPEPLDDACIAAEARRHGVSVLPLKPLYIGPAARPGLVMGFAAADRDAITAGVQTLAAVIESMGKGL